MHKVVLTVWQPDRYLGLFIANRRLEVLSDLFLGGQFVMGEDRLPTIVDRGPSIRVLADGWSAVGRCTGPNAVAG